MSEVVLDGTLNSLLAYLQQIVGHHDAEQPCKERELLEHGRPFEPRAFSRDERVIVDRYAACAQTPLDRFERQQCFSNAQRLVTAGPDGPLVYVEGYVFQKRGIPIHHGWVVINGKVVDVTLLDRTTGAPILGTFIDRVYFGIPFKTRLVRTEMLRTMSASTLLGDATGLEVDRDGSVSRAVRGKL